MRSSCRITGLLFVLCALSLPVGARDRGGAANRGRHACPSSIDIPVHLRLAAPERAIKAGATVRFNGEIEATVSLGTVRLSLTAEGPVKVLGRPEIVLRPPLRRSAGPVRLTFQVPVQYLGEGESQISVRLLANGPAGVRYEKTEALYTILRGGRALSGMGGYLPLQMRALEEDVRAGRLDEAQARAQARQIQALPARIDQVPRPRKELTFEQQRLTSALAAAARMEARPTRIVPQSAGGQVTVQGTASWLDENGTVHPAFGMLVEVRDSELIGSDLVAEGLTDVNGQYSFTVNNDDGPLQGDRDIFVRFITSNGAVNIRTAGIFGAPYEADSPVHSEVPDGTTITENITCDNTGTGPACGLETGASYVAAYAAILNGGTFLGGLNIEWPGDPGSANYNGSRINLRPGDRFDWDVMFHEYGHYVMDTFDFEDNPGGPHNIGDCISDVHSSKDQGLRLAWGEGWPTYFGTAAQQVLNLASLGVPRVGDVSYTDTGESNFTYSLEAQDNLGLGEDNEIAVQRMLWDLFDTPADGRDTVNLTDQELFDVVNAADPTTLSAAWAAIRFGRSNGDDLAIGAIATDHAVGPALAAPAPGAIVGPGASFSWTRAVGCSTTFDGDSFDLVFYDASGLSRVLTVPGLGTNSTALSQGQYDTLIAAGHQMVWAVEGRNTNGPATGPYLGESFPVTVNRKPVANAGPDQPAIECTSPTTTAVSLNGTGSTDPDGDALTYLWSAPGVVFDDPTSATPIGQFHKGTTIATLTVSDSIQQDSDTMSATVVDTTPPVITCPANIVIECAAAGGTAASDPQLNPFFAGVSATDVCDTTPTITNNAPAFFPLGTTPVTFTAKDDDGNPSSCVATVTVKDTTPPLIDMALDKSVLWPPNHKLIPVHATVHVTDVCDPNPTFILSSILSNEPDNGTGDGDTVNDIQGAAFGTADVDFQLRAERKGNGSGRIYTVKYTGKDGSGNSTPTTKDVTVPHNQ
jgi:hypothetical protein